MARPAIDGGFPLAWIHYAYCDVTRQPVWESAGRLAQGRPGAALAGDEWVVQLTNARTRVARAFTRDWAKKYCGRAVDGMSASGCRAGRLGHMLWAFKGGQRSSGNSLARTVRRRSFGGGR